MAPKDFDFAFSEIRDVDGKLKEVTFMPSTLETIDMALFDFVNDELNIHSKTNKGFKKASVIWVSSERAFQIKNDKNLRDSTGKLILPMVTIERTSIEKDPNFKGISSAYTTKLWFKEKCCCSS